jgi:hypothetical protein
MTDATMTAGPIDAARRQLRSTGACLIRPAELNTCIGTDDAEWERFAMHWEGLALDEYAAKLGTQRFRRYGHFKFTPADGTAILLPHRMFVQPDDSNPLYIDTGRRFEPLTDSFVNDPLLHRILALLGRIGSALDDVAAWHAKVTPFRVLATSDGGGQPTPEGPHRDGVTLVTSLLIGRSNATGGESVVCDPAGNEVMSATLAEPGTLLLGDDRHTMHGVSPIRPVDPAAPARRDVLVITLAP